MERYTPGYVPVAAVGAGCLWAPAAPFGGVGALYVLCRQVYETAGIDAVDLSIPEEAWQSLTGPQAAVASLGARLTWGIAAVLAFSRMMRAQPP